MAKLVFPDPRDRSVNSPAVLVSSKEVTDYWTQQSGKFVTSDINVIRDWYTAEAMRVGWDKVEFQGGYYQCLLKANVAIVYGSTREVVSSTD
jgi:hypothetical protein